jgi:hypothetical protein
MLRRFICVLVSSCFGVVLFGIALQIVWANSLYLVETENKARLYSRFNLPHEWKGTIIEGFADGSDGQLIVYTRNAWPSRDKVANFTGDMKKGQFSGWVESYFYSEGRYWLGELENMRPVGCGISAPLNSYGGRVDSALQIVWEGKTNDIELQKEICSEQVQKKLSKRVGERVGKALFSCVVERKPKCFKW